MRWLNIKTIVNKIKKKKKKKKKKKMKMKYYASSTIYFLVVL